MKWGTVDVSWWRTSKTLAQVNRDIVVNILVKHRKHPPEAVNSYWAPTRYKTRDLRTNGSAALQLHHKIQHSKKLTPELYTTGSSVISFSWTLHFVITGDTNVLTQREGPPNEHRKPMEPDHESNPRPPQQCIGCLSLSYRRRHSMTIFCALLQIWTE